MSVTGVAGMYNIKRLSPEVIPPSEVYAGTPALFLVRIRKGSQRLPSFLVRAESASGTSATIAMLRPGAFADVPLEVTFPQRGRAQLGAITLSSPFPVSFFTRYWTFTFGDDVVVFPRLLPARAGVVGDAGDDAGNSSHRERGHDGELERIALYSGSEPLRMIHWRLSARADDLFVKQFGSQMAEPLLIDLDTLPGRDIEDRISRAAWLVKQWVGRRPVGLCWQGHATPAEAGWRHGRQLLSELALYGLD